MIRTNLIYPPEGRAYFTRRLYEAAIGPAPGSCSAFDGMSLVCKTYRESFFDV